ncbi:Imm1 family immunity protein [Actinokineospora inagensis]|uniref:Imm1 family immunity protein n=1 Tax=Actinokineospora inagensis TaxID=103730 RepID=UPI00047A26B0|nr:Imm1 family immunity protein [Actinokineospora inagensis]
MSYWAPVLERGWIAVDDLPPEVDLLAAVKQLNEHGVEVLWVWELASRWAGEDDPEGEEQQESLTIGVFNETGVLTWRKGFSLWAPTRGLNTEWEDARLAGFYEVGIPPRSIVPIDVVYTALAEFLSTGSRPTSVEWELGERMPGIPSEPM